jgi:hypothetical protein
MAPLRYVVVHRIEYHADGGEISKLVVVRFAHAGIASASQTLV